MSINGGTDQFQFYGSGSYLSNEGITNGADFKRYNGMMKVDYQARKWLKIGGTARYIHTNSNSNNYAYYGTLTTPCIYPVYIRDANGNIMTDANGKVYDYGDGLVTGVIVPTTVATTTFRTIYSLWPTATAMLLASLPTPTSRS